MAAPSLPRVVRLAGGTAGGTGAVVAIGADRDAVLRAAVGAITGADPAVVRLGASCEVCGGDDHGRPRAWVDGSEVPVSVAHASGRTLAAAMSAGSIGVDAEPLAVDPARTDGVADVLGLGEGPHDPADVLGRWVTVEAVLKADGRGLLVDPRDVTVDADGRHGVRDDPRRYGVTAVALDPGLLVSVATATGPSGTPAPRGRRASGRTADRGSSR